MQLYALLLLWLLIPRTTHNCSQLSFSNWKQLCYTVIMIYTLIRTFTNVSRQLFKSMHFMHRWWSSSEACKAPVVERQRVECLLHVQPLSSQLPVHSDHNISLPRVVNLLHLAPSFSDWSPTAVNEQNHSYNHTHLPANSSYYLHFLPSYCYSQVVFFNNAANSTTLCAPDLEHNNTPSSLRNAFFSTVPTIYHRFLSTCFYNNRMVHWTYTKLDSHYTSFYSCHHIECNTAQMHIANEY